MRRKFVGRSRRIVELPAFLNNRRRLFLAINEIRRDINRRYLPVKIKKNEKKKKRIPLDFKAAFTASFLKFVKDYESGKQKKDLAKQSRFVALNMHKIRFSW